MTDVDQTQLLRQVRLALQDHDYNKAIEYLKKAANLAHQAGDYGTEGRHLGNLALIYYRQEQPDKALSYFDQALDRARKEDDRLTEDGLLGNMGNILRELKRYDEAINYLNQALLIANEVGDVRGRGLWLGNLGLVYDDLRQPARAIELHEQSVAIARQLQDRRGLASRLANLGNSYVAAQDYLAAVKYFEEAIELYQSLGDQPGLALRLGVMGNIYGELGRKAADSAQSRAYLESALDYYRRAQTLAREAGDKVFEAGILRGMGNAYGNMGEYDQAIAHFELASQYFAELGLHEQRIPLQRSIDLALMYRDRKAGTGDPIKP